MNWHGGKSRGKGKNAWYGSFWDGKRTVRAHIWAAENIHGLTRPPGYQIDHMCRNTLCVQHLQSVPALDNWAYRYLREENGWIEPLPEPNNWARWDMVPFYWPPHWLGDNVRYEYLPFSAYGEPRVVWEDPVC